MKNTKNIRNYFLNKVMEKKYKMNKLPEGIDLNDVESTISFVNFLNHRTIHREYEIILKKILDKKNIDINDYNLNLEDFISKNKKFFEGEEKDYFLFSAWGLWNHNFFFEQITSFVWEDKKDLNLIKENNIENLKILKERLIENAKKIKGSGWTWLTLYIDESNKSELKIINTKNEENPLDINLNPIICLDMWEHSYYRDYNIKSEIYIRRLLDIINWELINKRYLKIKEKYIKNGAL